MSLRIQAASLQIKISLTCTSWSKITLQRFLNFTNLQHTRDVGGDQLYAQGGSIKTYIRKLQHIGAS